MRTPGRTLISRIVLTTLVVTAVAMVAMVATVMLVLSALTRNEIDNRLHDQLAAVSSTVEVAGDGTVTAPETQDDSIDDTTWIFTSDGQLVQGPHVAERVTNAAESLSGIRREARLNRYERSFLAAPVDRDGKVAAVVVVAAHREPYESTRNVTLVGLIVLGIAVTAGSGAIAWWTVRRTLGPVESMALRAEDWSERDLDSRFEATDTDDEFGRLGRTLNVLLDRVAGALRSEQQLTSEVAHELRTPLTAIRGEAELGMMTADDPELRERFGRVVDVVDRMSSTISSLVAIARDAPRSDARTTAEAVVTATLEHLDTAGIEVSVAVDAIEIAAPIELAMRALAPVAENALRHASSSVRFTAATHDRTVDITVSDDGEGMGTDDTESVFVSGHRGPRSDGAGLGLALARRVARTLGGDVRVTSISGPTSFTLALPRN
jgi:signal transduction histidine kinase